jgi:hypothetical protein
MTETEQWRAERERYLRFMDTELGKLYAAYTKALIDNWRVDADETVSTAKLKALEEVLREKQQAFTAKLMEIAGV